MCIIGVVHFILVELGEGILVGVIDGFWQAGPILGAEQTLLLLANQRISFLFYEWQHQLNRGGER